MGRKRPSFRSVHASGGPRHHPALRLASHGPGRNARPHGDRSCVPGSSHSKGLCRLRLQPRHQAGPATEGPSLTLEAETQAGRQQRAPHTRQDRGSEWVERSAETLQEAGDQTRETRHRGLQLSALQLDAARRPRELNPKLLCQPLDSNDVLHPAASRAHDELPLRQRGVPDGRVGFPVPHAAQLQGGLLPGDKFPPRLFAAPRSLAAGASGPVDGDGLRRSAGLRQAAPEARAQPQPLRSRTDEQRDAADRQGRVRVRHRHDLRCDDAAHRHPNRLAEPLRRIQGPQRRKGLQRREKQGLK
mmetsp:Transcript_52968/g.126059  ORF Transcript_52968/g.126059 Transcript_52968/m.126059 type:complete len:302 (+) Transcript_52968:892-1797(+)